MRLWRVVVLINLSLGLGLLLGYLAWGRETVRLGDELQRARQQQLVAGVERTWHSRAIVRAVLPELNVVVLTHEDLAGYMGSMTMGFRVHDPQLYQGLDIGDVVSFTLTGVPPNVEITALAKETR
ncbi:MAG TPA: copper-binding protein [Candidatus Dormibacteraeota bacterium]|jgi:Cu/Ag efflux protein CusF|nr:copper-binding protein [Candidatus Dormibacteraeota bacterium]